MYDVRKREDVYDGRLAGETVCEGAITGFRDDGCIRGLGRGD
jgi:hypothetical protein